MRARALPLWLLVSAGSALVGSGADAAGVVLVGQERSLLADGAAHAASGSAFDGRESFAADAAPFADTADALADAGDAAGGAAADQDSQLGAGAWNASGSTHAQASAAGDETPIGSFAAESFFDVVFVPEEAVSYALDGSLEASELADGDAFASVELLREVAGQPALALVSRELLLSGSDVFSEAGVLEAGVTYRLRLVARTVARVGAFAPEAEGGAAYQLDVHFAPEPGATCLAAAAAAALGVLGRARRRSLVA
jgi:hypothetical protein